MSEGPKQVSKCLQKQMSRENIRCIRGNEFITNVGIGQSFNNSNFMPEERKGSIWGVLGRI